MPKFMKEQIMKVLLRKLINKENWGGKHTPLIRLKKHLPRNIRGDKVTKDAIKELVNLEFVLIKKSTGDLHISLNSRMKKEIYEFLK